MKKEKYFEQLKLTNILQIISWIPLVIGAVLLFVLPTFKASFGALGNEWPAFDLLSDENESSAGLLLIGGLALTIAALSFATTVIQTFTLKECAKKDLWDAKIKPERISKIKAQAKTHKGIIIISIIIAILLIAGIVCTVESFSQFRADMQIPDVIDVHMGSGAVSFIILSVISVIAACIVETYKYLLAKNTEPDSEPAKPRHRHRTKTYVFHKNIRRLGHTPIWRIYFNVFYFCDCLNSS